MPRRTRLSLVGMPLHIVQRGNNRQQCFLSGADVRAFAHWLREASIKFHVSIHAWVFMTNHVHLLVTPEREAAASKMMQCIGRQYVRYFNHKYERSGTLWEGRFHSSLVQADAHLLSCYRYIELNPVRAGMVIGPDGYSWSSYRANAFGVDAKMLTPHPVYLALGIAEKERQARYRKFVESETECTKLQDIRYAIQKGLLLGSQQFKSRIGEMTGKRVEPRKRGRPAV